MPEEPLVRKGEYRYSNTTKVLHGTYGGYTNHKCRCAACKEANRVAKAAYVAAHPEQREKKRLREQERRAAVRGDDA